MKIINIKKIAALFSILAINFLAMSNVFAEVPQKIVYEAQLLDSSGEPLTTSHEFRFSFWNSGDFISTDKDVSGNINTAAPTYGNWTEEQTISPAFNGTFSVNLGDVTALPNINEMEHLYLQVEVKAVGAPDTAYEILDPTGDNGVDTKDRETIGSLPYAFNADDALSSSQEIFVIDSDNTIETAGTGVIQLQFGETLGKVLEYDTDNGYFNFNDDVNIDGDLTVNGDINLTGLVNGVDISNLSTSTHGQNTDSGTDQPTFEINNSGNGATLSTAGLTGDITVTFDNANTKVVGENNTQTLTNKTIDGDDNTIQDLDISAFKDVNKTQILLPEYNGMSILEDGTSNQATMRQGRDTNGLAYYVLSSEEPTLQDLDIYIDYQIPLDFQSWQATPIQINLRSLTTNITQNQMDLSLSDTSGTNIPLTNGADLASSVADTWTTKSVTFAGGTFTPGGTITLKISLQAHSGNRIYVSKILLNYVGKLN